MIPGAFLFETAVFDRVYRRINPFSVSYSFVTDYNYIYLNLNVNLNTHHTYHGEGGVVTNGDRAPAEGFIHLIDGGDAHS